VPTVALRGQAAFQRSPHNAMPMLEWPSLLALGPPDVEGSAGLRTFRPAAASAPPVLGAGIVHIRRMQTALGQLGVAQSSDCSRGLARRTFPWPGSCC
jgi:hypothetical protein